MVASWSTAVSRLCSGKQGESKREDDEVSDSENTNSRKGHTQKQGSKYRHPPPDTYTACSSHSPIDRHADYARSFSRGSHMRLLVQSQRQSFGPFYIGFSNTYIDRGSHRNPPLPRNISSQFFLETAIRRKTHDYDSHPSKTSLSLSTDKTGQPRQSLRLRGSRP